MGTMLARATARGTLAQVRHVTPVPAGAARGPVAEVYRQMGRDFGMLAPPISLHSPSPTATAAAWVLLRETLLVAGRAARPTKEVVASAVSLANACPYCVEVHTTVLGGLAPSESARAIAAGHPETLADPTLRSVALWARDGTAGRPPRVPTDQVPELIAVAVVFHYLNRMVNIFLPASPIPDAVPATVRGWLRPLLGRLMSRVAPAAPVPGTSLDLLPPAPLPARLSWAAGEPRVAEAVARAAAALEAAAARSVPPAVRELVLGRLVEWDGTRSAEPGRSWVEEALEELDRDDRSAGRLALLTAFASYQVGPTVIDRYRRRHPDDRSLVELASWSSLAAAGRIGGLLHARTRPMPPPAPVTA